MFRGGAAVTIDDIHIVLAKHVLGEHPNDAEAMALMVLLHTHRIRLKYFALIDRPNVVELAAITQRHAAETIAACWQKEPCSERASYHYWYFKFNTQTPYETIEDVPAEWRVRMDEMRDRLKRHAIVEDVIVEE